MSIQITSSSQENFLKIQESLEKLNPKFIEKFQHAKYIMEGIDHDIELTTEFYYEETIILPENFKINRIKFNEILILSKSK